MGEVVRKESRREVVKEGAGVPDMVREGES